MYERVFTRSVHQPPTYKALTNQGGGASVYRPRSLLQYRRQSPSKRAYNTICISCPWIRLTRAIKLVRTLISERAQISNHSTTPPERYSTATTRSYPSTTCWKVGSWGLRTYHQLRILIQVLVRFTGSIIDANTDLYGTPYPHLLRTSNPYSYYPSLNTSDH